MKRASPRARRALLWQLYLPYVIITILLLTILAAFALGVPADSENRSRTILVAWGSCVATASISFFFVVSRISRRVRAMRIGARRFARGELGVRLPIGGADDLSGLADALNTMASQLDERIRLILAQRNEQEAVLSSMVEGVIGLDSQGTVLNINSAARELLNLGADQLVERNFLELIRNYQLHQFVSQALSRAEEVEADIGITSPEVRWLQARATPLRSESGEVHGAVLVLHDVTRVRKLEEVRRDFVANVSHELRTPLTSIKGFVETLLDGALENPEDARRFLQIILRQVNSLNEIIEDLLRLSRLEQEATEATLPREEVFVREVLDDVDALIAARAAEKRIQVRFDCSPTLRAQLNRSLFEHALVNLADNAIKYSEPQRELTIVATDSDGNLRLEVRDQGWGIERHHLPRLFERFYRVDRARDKKSGGTGLGLAIVKHVIAAHGGQIEVESAPGKGSTFRITVPTMRGSERSEGRLN